MDYDELAFFNRQLAAMLQDGIPLEGALKQLCIGMKTGPLRTQMTELEADLARGTPLKDALARRALPEFYLRMVDSGARSNDLPAMLTLLADHYERANALWRRLKGLMVYPLIVIVVALGLTIVLSIVFSHFLLSMMGSLALPSTITFMNFWVPPVLMAIVAVIAFMAVSAPRWRARLRWRLPAFREASLSQLASAMALMLRNGMPLPDALAAAEAVESNSPAGAALAKWRMLIEQGNGKAVQWPGSLRPFPPMFLWLVQKGGEDPAAGFEKAAHIYHARASYRIEMALYGALPVSILLLGQMILWQVMPLMRSLTWFMQALGATY